MTSRKVRGNGIITGEIARAAMDLMRVDPLGLDDSDHLVLQTLIENFDGGPVGLKTLAVAINEESETLEEVFEPYLIQIGFLNRTPQGRVAARRAWEHLGYKFPVTPTARDLFE